MYEIVITSENKGCETYSSKHLKYIKAFKETIGRMVAEDANDTVTYQVYNGAYCIDQGEISLV